MRMRREEDVGRGGGVNEDTAHSITLNCERVFVRVCVCVFTYTTGGERDEQLAVCVTRVPHFRVRAEGCLPRTNQQLPHVNEAGRVNKENPNSITGMIEQHEIEERKYNMWPLAV